MASFKAAEKALVEELRSLSFLHGDNCRAGETDACFRHVLENNEKFLCVTDYAGGSSAGNRIWSHSISVMFAIRVEDETVVEKDVRAVVDEFFELMHPENRLGGVADAHINNAQAPVPAARNDIPFVYLFFMVNALQRMARKC